MTNIDRAAEIIDSLHTADQIWMEGRVGYFEAPAAAQALADAGLLAPDLPEPSNPGIFIPNGKGWLPCGPDGPSVWTAPHGRVMVQRIEPGELTPGEARELGLALLTAAQHAEEHHAS